MNIFIRPARPGDNRWQVGLDSQRVSFRSEAEAGGAGLVPRGVIFRGEPGPRRFVATLQRRIAEPHALPKAG